MQTGQCQGDPSCLMGIGLRTSRKTGAMTLRTGLRTRSKREIEPSWRGNGLTKWAQDGLIKVAQVIKLRCQGLGKPLWGLDRRTKPPGGPVAQAG